MGAARDLYISLREKGVPKEEAARQAREAQQLAEAPALVAPSEFEREIPTAEAAGAGVIQGAMAGFADEFMGAMSELYWPESLAGPMDYKTMRDSVRDYTESARHQHPYAYGAGGVGGAVLTGAPLGAAQGLKGAIGVGGALGAATGLGESEGETVGQLAGDTVTGGVIGALGGGVGYGAAKGAGAVYRGGRNVVNRLARPEAAARQAATDTAAEVAAKLDKPSLIGTGEGTARESLDAAQRFEQRASERIGEEFRFRPSQLTGDPEAALAERLAAQNPDTMNAAQSMALRQLRQSEKLLESFADNIAANPDKLGRADVSGAMRSALAKSEEALYTLRSQAARPVYQAAESALGKEQVFPVKPVRDAFAALEDSKPLSGATKALRKKIAEAFGKPPKAAEGGAVPEELSDIARMNGLRSFLGDVMAGREKLADVDVRQARWAASELLKGVEDSFAKAEAAIPEASEAGRLFRQGNTIWREYTEEIDSRVTKLAKDIIGGDATKDTDANLVDLLVSRGPKNPEAVRRVFGLLEDPKIGKPEIAKDVRAQVLEQIFEKGGKAPRGATYTRELGASKLKPGTLLTQLTKAEPMLQAAFANDGEARLALKESMFLAQRLGFGPGIAGSDTAPKAMMAAKEAVGKVADKIPSPTVKALSTVVQIITKSDAAKAKAFSSREGVMAFRDALRQLANAKAKPKMSGREIMATFVRLGVPEAVMKDETDARRRAAEERMKRTAQATWGAKR